MEIAGGLRNKDLDGDGLPMPVLVGHDETIYGHIRSLSTSATGEVFQNMIRSQEGFGCSRHSKTWVK